MIEERQQKLVQEFSKLPTWEDRYKLIIEKGKALSPFPEEYRKEEFKVRGCQSQVWLHASINKDGRMNFVVDSDALIVRGLAALLHQLYNDGDPNEILISKVDFIKELGFQSALSPSRSNGFMSMIKQIKNYAQAFVLLKK